MRISLAFFLSIFISFSAFSQKRIIDNIQVKENNKTLVNAMAGGLNSPVISPINLNGDIYPDLFIMDKYGSKILTFINQGPGKYPSYVYAPTYEASFPKNLWGWAVIRDYNKDGVPDIFSLVNAGIQCHRGKIVNGVLSFDLVKPLLEYDFGGLTNIWTFQDDMPGFIDVNNDGDLDLLVYNIFGGTAIEYYENTSIENGNGLDSLTFELRSTCWGGFAESALDFTLALGACKNGTQIPQSNSSRHQGGTLFPFDYDMDGDVDLIIGDVSYSNMVYAHNAGDSSYATVDSFDAHFPTYDVPVNFPIFPAAYPLDVNYDNRADIMVSSYYSSPQLGVAEDVNTIQLYQNRRLGGKEQFQYKGDTFFVNQMFDMGSDSRPMFVDIDKDGKQDIVMGISGQYSSSGIQKTKLAYLRNVSRGDTAIFDVVSRDFCNLSQFSYKGLFPSFGDLDGDSLADMLIGDSFGYMHFFKHNGSTTAPYTTVTTPQFFGIDVGQNARPFVFDVNKDGLNDIVVGNFNGKIQYYWNFGTKTNPQFSLDSVNAFFGEVQVNEYYINVLTGNASPAMTQENGKMYLYSGSERGIVFKFEVDAQKLRSGAFSLVDSNILKYHAGGRSTISVADVNGDGKNDYVVGNVRGGLQIFSDTLWTGSTNVGVAELNAVKSIFSVYPNPAKQVLYVESLDQTKESSLMLYSLEGRLLYTANFEAKSKIDLSSYAAGSYVLKIDAPNGVETHKFVLIK